MKIGEFLGMIERLPAGANIVVRGGLGSSGDAWTPTIKVFKHGGKLTAVVEADRGSEGHSNYPENCAGVEDVTNDYFGEKEEPWRCSC